MAIPFLRRVLQEPGYGWSRNGELYKPTVSESMREWLWWGKTRFGELTEAREPAQALPVSDELSDPLAPPGGQRSHRRWGRLRLIDDRVQRGLQGQHGEEVAGARRADGVGALDSNRDLPTDVVAVASGCERRGDVPVEAAPESPPSSR